jgi:hypothetical protein
VPHTLRSTRLGVNSRHLNEWLLISVKGLVKGSTLGIEHRDGQLDLL